MADDPLRELLSSPLEQERPQRRRDRVPSDNATNRIGPWLPVGIAVGALAVAFGVLVGGDDATPTTVAAAETTTSTTTEPTASNLFELPPGYTPVADGRFGLQVERVLIRPDAVFVSVSTVVPSGVDGDQSAGFPSALWELLLVDGRSVSSLIESRSASSPGFVTIRFEADGYAADEIESLRMIGVASRLGDDHTTVAETFTLPDDAESQMEVPLAQSSFELDVGVTLEFGDILFRNGVGTLEWRLEGTAENARAAVFPQLTITDPATGTQYAVNTGGSFGGFVFNPSGVNFYEDAAMSRGDTVTFSPIDPQLAFPTDVPLEAALTISVSWDVFTPTDVTIPIDGVVVVEI